MTLFDAKPGKKYLVRKLDMEEKIERRLEALGLTENSIIELLSRKHGGAMIVKIRGTRFALGKEICESIYIWGDNNEK